MEQDRKGAVNSLKKQRFDVTGMSCAACQAHVEKAVGKVGGVKNVSVSLLTGSMNVEFDEAACSDSDIISAVKGAGYGAGLPSGKNASPDISDKAAGDAAYKKRRLWLSIGFMVPLFYLCMGPMAGLPVPGIFSGRENAMVFALTQLLLAGVVSVINFDYFKNGFKALFHLAPNMDSLIALGACASFVFSLAKTFMAAYRLGRGDTAAAGELVKDLYFDSCAMILTLIDVGKYLEARSKGKTADAVKKLISLAPKTAVVIRDGEEVEIPAAEVVVGDVFVLRSGSAVPCDGEVISGSCTADESALTGESLPVEKQEGSKLMSASVITGGYVRCRCEKTAEDSTLSEIIKLVEQTQTTKAPVARLADRISGVFVPVVIGISLVTLIVWLAVGKELSFALGMAVSVLVISCPCSLGLATPTAIMVATGKAASLGILIRSAQALEQAQKTTVAVLDKTGTCTEGRPELEELIVYGGHDRGRLLGLISAAESLSSHPLAWAVCEYAKKEGAERFEAGELEEYQGGGICAAADGESVVIGNAALMEKKGIDISAAAKQAESFSQRGAITLFAAVSERLSALLVIADRIKDTSEQAVREFSQLGIKTVMLTGDNERTAKAVGEKLGIDEIKAGLLPSDKARIVSQLGAGTVMVGDGINDAPALTAADVGIALGAGRDIAVEAADIVLMKNDLRDAVTAIRLSRAAMRNIRQNLFWALFYNSLGIPIAAGALYPLLGLRLDPMLGAAAMSLSSVCVVTNALRLNLFKDGRQPDPNEITLRVRGMMCDHCTATVEKALMAQEGVLTAKADFKKNVALVRTNGNADPERLKQAIRKAGYKVR